MRIVDIDTQGEFPSTIDVDDISSIYPLYGGENSMVSMKNGVGLQVSRSAAADLVKLWKGEITEVERRCSC